MKKRTATVRRKTSETDITVKLNIDGTGKANIKTPIGFLNHMLELFAFHGLFDLDINALGDIKVDIHHSNEDVGIVLGEVFKKALGTKLGIRRFGSASVPMEEVVAIVSVDISGRGYFNITAKEYKPTQRGVTEPITEGKYELQDVEHFWSSFAKHLGMNLNIKVDPISSDLHTTLEPIFKALGIALDQATQIDPRRMGIPSTKGIID